MEDDSDIRQVTTLLLSDIEDFEVKACGTAAEALQVAQAFDPDLILLDVMMPDLDGQGAFVAFRQMPDIALTPVIFMTARVQPSQILEYRQLGSLGVIPKPFDPDTLAETIQGMWERHQKACITETRRKDLAALRTLYVAELPERLRAIEAATGSLRDDGWDSEVAASLYDMAHRLAGSAAIYGFPEVSDAAVRVSAFGNGPGAVGRPKIDTGALVKLATALCSALRQSVAGVDDGGAEPPA